MKKQSVIFLSLGVLLSFAPLAAVEPGNESYWQKALGQLVGPQYQETLSQLGQLFGGSSQPTTPTEQNKYQKTALYQAVANGDSQRVHQILNAANFDKETLIEYALLAEQRYLDTQEQKFRDTKAIIENKINPSAASSGSKSFGLSDIISTLGTYMGGTQQSQPANQGNAVSTIMDFIKQYGAKSDSQTQTAQNPKTPAPKSWLDYFGDK